MKNTEKRPAKKKAPILATPHVFYVRPAPGWLDVCEQEIKDVLAHPLHRYKFEPLVTALKGVIKIHRCDFRQGLEVLLRLTTGHDVEWLLVDSVCGSWDRLHKILKALSWDEYFAAERPTVHVTAKASSGFTSSSAKLRDAVLLAGGFTASDEEGDCRLKIDVHHERVKVTLSLAGDALYRRGYKAKMFATAPLAEHHAAACARWALDIYGDDQPAVSDIFVPFAGTGTLGFEALVTLSSSGPGSFPRLFAADLLKCTPPATMEFVRRKLRERLTTGESPRVTFVDINTEAMDALRSNTAAFPTKTAYELIAGDVFAMPNFTFKSSGPVMVLLNPPFGHRLGKASDVVTLYRRLGAAVASWHSSATHGTFGACICPDEDSWKAFCRELKGLELGTRHFTHGGEDVRLVRWRMAAV